jgi:hypothetical protein
MKWQGRTAIQHGNGSAPGLTILFLYLVEYKPNDENIMRNAQLPFRMFCARSAGLETAANSKYEAKTVKRWHLK